MALSADGRYTGATFDTDLATVAAVWASLPAALKAGIMAMVKAASVGGKP